MRESKIARAQGNRGMKKGGMETRSEEVSVNKSAGGNCRGRDESDPTPSVEAVSDSPAKNARETRQVGERVAGPVGHYVHSDSMDERLHARPAALQVSTPALPMRNLATLVMKRERNAKRGLRVWKTR